jgi:predicted negative regulator of RcsB-dependent stress response
VEVYETEQQQVEALQKWWKENGASVMAGLAIGFALLFAWRAWQSHVAVKAEAASIGYQGAMSKIEDKDPEAALLIGKTVLDEQSKTIYAALTAFTLAKVSVDKNDLGKAREYLQKLISDYPHDDGIKNLARMRLARIQVAEGKAGEALSTLDPMKKSAEGQASYHELRGDVLLALGKPDEARGAYAQALALAEGRDSGNLQMKLDDLAKPSKAVPAAPVAAQAPAPTTPAPAPAAPATPTAAGEKAAPAKGKAKPGAKKP